MTSNKTKVFIDGQHGTTGLQILDRLKDRPDIELLELPMADRKDLGKRAEIAKSAVDGKKEMKRLCQDALDREAAERAIRKHVAEPLGISVTEAAAGIQEIVNENMANATRLHVSERGRDLRRFGLLAFGGAGPVHAYRVAQLLGL